MLKKGDYVCLKADNNKYETPFFQVYDITDSQVKLLIGTGLWIDKNKVYDCSDLPKTIRKFMEDAKLLLYQKFMLDGYYDIFWIDTKGKLCCEAELSQETFTLLMYDVLTDKIKLIPFFKGLKYFYFDFTKNMINLGEYEYSLVDNLNILAQNFFLTYTECENSINKLKSKLAQEENALKYEIN